MASVSTAAASLLTVALVFAFLARKRRRSTLPLPPGPRPLPFIGNALDMPSKEMRTAFREMNEKYGDIVYLDALGQPMIIVGSHEVAVDLLDKRSSNYSDRGSSAMIDIVGAGWAVTLLRYGEEWRRHRRAIHQYFNAGAVAQYAKSQKLETHRLVRRLIDDPEHFRNHLRHFFGSSALRISHGIEVDDEPVDYLKIADDAMDIFAAAFEPGKYLVEIIPWLARMPSWFPGAGAKRDGEVWRPIIYKMVSAPWDAAMEKMRLGTASPSMVKGLVEQMREDDGPDQLEVIKSAAAVTFAAGSDTTFSTMQTFFMAMTMYPEVQKKAQDELMAVIGPHRLPEKDDEPSLPYIQAITKECIRWRSVVPLNVPHRSLEDDEYKGYFIPKGSIIITNISAFSHDPIMYPNPDVFSPERFLKNGKIDPAVHDPATMAFGYGRRVCPGKHFAETSLFIVIATVLHTLSLSPVVGPDGQPIMPSGKMTHGLLSYPEPFQCDIKSRSSELEALIRSSCTNMQGVRAAQS
ncbi:cytochrome P450 [Epithele typhae]|uniref:cytochrome P450 n=1 Tax=Epithele typhae TaxID=378194 RepID=UPI002008C6FC|nr:cytochrome P450 [Epithele typhae]KAH9929014.1 cytochrome P450 [Epithele typhae]